MKIIAWYEGTILNDGRHVGSATNANAPKEEPKMPASGPILDPST